MGGGFVRLVDRLIHRLLTGAVFGVAVCGVALNGVALADEPKATPGWGPQSACVSEQDVFNNDKGPHFSITLTNKCEAKLTCRVWGYITTARGPTQGARDASRAEIGGAAMNHFYVSVI